VESHHADLKGTRNVALGSSLLGHDFCLRKLGGDLCVRMPSFLGHSYSPSIAIYRDI
jgi:hypothetical protein